MGLFVPCFLHLVLLFTLNFKNDPFVTSATIKEVVSQSDQLVSQIPPEYYVDKRRERSLKSKGFKQKSYYNDYSNHYSYGYSPKEYKAKTEKGYGSWYDDYNYDPYYDVTVTKGYKAKSNKSYKAKSQKKNKGKSWKEHYPIEVYFPSYDDYYYDDYYKKYYYGKEARVDRPSKGYIPPYDNYYYAVKSSKGAKSGNTGNSGNWGEGASTIAPTAPPKTVPVPQSPPTTSLSHHLDNIPTHPKDEQHSPIANPGDRIKESTPSISGHIGSSPGKSPKAQSKAVAKHSLTPKSSKSKLSTNPSKHSKDKSTIETGPASKKVEDSAAKSASKAAAKSLSKSQTGKTTELAKKNAASQSQSKESAKKSVKSPSKSQTGKTTELAKNASQSKKSNESAKKSVESPSKSQTGETTELAKKNAGSQSQSAKKSVESLSKSQTGKTTELTKKNAASQSKKSTDFAKKPAKSQSETSKSSKADKNGMKIQQLNAVQFIDGGLECSKPSSVSNTEQSVLSFEYSVDFGGDKRKMEDVMLGLEIMKRKMIDFVAEKLLACNLSDGRQLREDNSSQKRVLRLISLNSGASDIVTDKHCTAEKKSNSCLVLSGIIGVTVDASNSNSSLCNILRTIEIYFTEKYQNDPVEHIDAVRYLNSDDNSMCRVETNSFRNDVGSYESESIKFVAGAVLCFAFSLVVLVLVLVYRRSSKPDNHQCNAVNDSIPNNDTSSETTPLSDSMNEVKPGEKCQNNGYSPLPHSENNSSQPITSASQLQSKETIIKWSDGSEVTV